MRWILSPTDHQQAQDMGGKARALADLNRASFPIPNWFVIRGESCLESLGEIGRSKLAASRNAAEIQELLKDLKPDAAIMEEINWGLSNLCKTDGFVAVRSSASDEDGADYSFAGQLDSYLFVAPDRVAERIVDV